MGGEVCGLVLHPLAIGGPTMNFLHQLVIASSVFRLVEVDRSDIDELNLFAPIDHMENRVAGGGAGMQLDEGVGDGNAEAGIFVGDRLYRQIGIICLRHHDLGPARGG